MNFYLIVFVLLIAVFYAGVFSFIFRIRGPWGKFWSFLMVLFFALWAGSVWIEPVGPHFNDVRFLSVILMGLVISLILVAATPGRYRYRKAVTDKDNNNEDSISAIVGVMFWVLILSLILAIVFKYANN